MNNSTKFLVNQGSQGVRLDIFLSNKIKNLSRSFIKSLIENNNVKINHCLIKSPATKVKLNDEVLINLINKSTKKLVPKKIDINIIFEDKDILIVDKPKGMIVHPGAGNYDNTLANALAYKYKKNYLILMENLDLA